MTKGRARRPAFLFCLGLNGFGADDGLEADLPAIEEKGIIAEGSIESDLDV
jgi:hypothetical protein